MVEWLLVTGLMVAMLLAYRLVFALALLPQLPFGFAVVQVLWSALAYPLVVGASRLVLDLRKPAMGETDDYGGGCETHPEGKRGQRPRHHPPHSDDGRRNGRDGDRAGRPDALPGY